ncbi:glycosyltransferase 61 family protein [Paracoccus sp. Z118]|uniref:glycosyltransferase 61 family protein n=1 Tax=Paracoccus sp. Z118 TaxID=2851017 RepID=UPI001C2C4FF4
MISFRPGLNALLARLGRSAPDLASRAEITEVEPGGVQTVPPAICLPGMMERMRSTEFAEPPQVLKHFAGGFDAPQPPTLSLRLKDVDLADGVLYAAGAARHMRPRSHRRPWYGSLPDLGRGTMYETWVGNSYFGNWLAEDCLTAILAERMADSPIVTTRPQPQGHMIDYQARLGMTPRHVTEGHFDELTLLEDHSAHAALQARAAEQRRRLIDGVDASPHPGVFILRGTSGSLRALADERQIAERLAHARGLTIVDVRQDDAATIIAVCAGARVAVGVEGSHLAHALVSMPPGAGLLTIHPPDRVTGGLKLMTDRRFQHYGILIGTGTAEHFAVEEDELLATFDIMAEAA